MNNPRAKRGFVIITIALSMFFLLGFAGLAIDVGFFRYVKRLAQNAADAGAVGAAMAMANTESGQTSGRVDAAKNGFTHGQDDVTVDVNSPPTKGFYAWNSGFVEVIVTQPRPTFFMNALGIDAATISARAVAYVQESGSGCIYIMAPSAKLAFTMTGGSTLNVGCGIYINSDHPNDAMNVGSASTINAVSINVIGGWDIHPSANVTPTPMHMDAYQSDPLAHIPEPQPEEYGDCDYTKPFVVSNTEETLSPGVYCKGIKISGKEAFATFLPGEYILMGGLLVKGGANAYAKGVTFFSTYNDTYPFLGYNITGGSTTEFSAPTDSRNPRAGMLFMTGPQGPQHEAEPHRRAQQHDHRRNHLYAGNAAGLQRREHRQRQLYDSGRE